jgi:hypothetical protein
MKIFSKPAASRQLGRVAGDASSPSSAAKVDRDPLDTNPAPQATARATVRMYAPGVRRIDGVTNVTKCTTLAHALCCNEELQAHSISIFLQESVREDTSNQRYSWCQRDDQTSRRGLTQLGPSMQSRASGFCLRLHILHYASRAIVRQRETLFIVK